MRQQELEDSPEPIRGEGPDPVDIHVGSRLKLRRNLLGMSQDQMGKALGLTFQQIQKYERAANRMSASRLYQMSKLLNVTVAWFFEELPDSYGKRTGFAENKQSRPEGMPEAAHPGVEILQKRETLDLIRAYYRITDPKRRRKVFELVQSMADTEE